MRPACTPSKNARTTRTTKRVAKKISATNSSPGTAFRMSRPKPPSASSRLLNKLSPQGRVYGKKSKDQGVPTGKPAAARVDHASSFTGTTARSAMPDCPTTCRLQLGANLSERSWTNERRRLARARTRAPPPTTRPPEPASPAGYRRLPSSIVSELRLSRISSRARCRLATAASAAMAGVSPASWLASPFSIRNTNLPSIWIASPSGMGRAETSSGPPRWSRTSRPFA